VEQFENDDFFSVGLSNGNFYIFLKNQFYFFDVTQKLEVKV